MLKSPMVLMSVGVGVMMLAMPYLMVCVLNHLKGKLVLTEYLFE